MAKAVSVPALEAASVVLLVAGSLAVPIAAAVVAVSIGAGRLAVRARITTAIVLAGSDAVAVARVKREIGRAPFTGGVRIGGVLPLIAARFVIVAFRILVIMTPCSRSNQRRSVCTTVA